MSELNDTYKQIGKAGFIILVLTTTDKLLAVVREVIVAHRFGISSELDVFNIAVALPGLVVLIFSGAITAAFVPLYLEWSYRRTISDANSQALSLLFFSVLFFGILAAAGYFFSSPIFSVIGYGFTDEAKNLGIILEKLLVFVILLDGAGIILMALLQAQKNFLSLQAAPILINITTIFLLVQFYESLGIYTLVWGLLLGTLFKTVYMAVVLRRRGFVFSTKCTFRRSDFSQFIVLALPLLGGTLITSVNLLIDQIMATKLTSGAVSTLRYAYRIYDLPIQIIILALSKAIFPFISEQAIKADYAGLRSIFKQSVIFLALLTFPIIVLLVLCSHDIVGILLERGAFDSHATHQTAQTLVWYGLGLFFYAYSFVNGAFFSALKNTKPLFYIGCLSVFFNILFNYIFMHFFGVKGIALSTTLTAGIASCIFLFWIKNRLGFSGTSGILKNTCIILLASGAMYAAGVAFHNFLPLADSNRFFRLGTKAAAVLACYVLFLWLFQTKELARYLHVAKRIFRGLWIYNQ